MDYNKISIDGVHVMVVEVDHEVSQDDLQLAGTPGTGHHVAQAFGDSLETVNAVLHQIREKLDAHTPTGIEVEFGIKLGGETGVIFAKGTAEANLTLRVSWEPGKPTSNRD